RNPSSRSWSSSTISSFTALIGTRLGARMLLVARVVLRVEVGEHPRADIVELNHRLLVHGHEVRCAGRKRDEASRRHGSRLVRIGLLTHPDTEGPRCEGPDL